ncbi:MAG: Hint domain-containing protein [Paracoccaceae bacterium]
MQAGYRGCFVIPLSATEIDGFAPPPGDALRVGALWRWQGEPVRVDGPGNVLLLHDAPAEADRRRRAARVVRRLLGQALPSPAAGRPDEAGPDGGFVVSDGRASWSMRLVEAPGGRLLFCAGALPPRDTELWVVSRDQVRATGAVTAGAAGAEGVVCFTPGTWVATPSGDRPVESLLPGDRVLTRDNGAQDVLWSGRRRFSGARLHAMPWLRPIRIREGALGGGRPPGDLVVSPGHRILIGGRRAARALWNEDEVLVAARNLTGARGIGVETGMPEVTYVHILTARHEIVRSNGVWTATFHPAEADLTGLSPGEREGLSALMPGIEADPFAYGGFARRSMGVAEAAILMHRAA